MYKSQIRQDEYISKFIFNEKKNGFFIELGAVDGITHSNTYYFEKVSLLLSIWSQQLLF